MANDRERDEEQESAPRPVTAASRRGRRSTGSGGNSSAEGATRTTSGTGDATGKDDGKPSGKAGQKSRAKSAAGSTATRPKADTSADKATTQKKGKPTRSRDRAEKPPALPVRVARFLRQVVNELRKVIWPTRKQMITYFSVVLVFLVVLVAFVFGLDVLFSKGMFLIFG